MVGYKNIWMIGWIFKKWMVGWTEEKKIYIKQMDGWMDGYKNMK